MKYAAALVLFTLIGAWVQAHTDEIPVVFALLALAAFLMGSFFPRYFLLSAFTLGLVPIAVELAAHFTLLLVPWPATPLPSLPLIALVCQIPTLIGSTLGWLVGSKLRPIHPESHA